MGTSFFNNIVSILETILNCENEDEWHVKLDLKRIPQEIADAETDVPFLNNK